MFSLSWISSLLPAELGFYLIQFLFSLQNFSLHFMWLRSAGDKFFQLCLSKNVFISLSFLKDIFIGYRIWNWQEFFSSSFST